MLRFVDWSKIGMELRENTGLRPLETICGVC